MSSYSYGSTPMHIHAALSDLSGFKNRALDPERESWWGA